VSRMSAEEFLDKDTDHKLWTMFDKMQDGDEIMGGLRTDVNDNAESITEIGTALDEHCDSTDAHQRPRDNPGTTSRIKEHKWKVLVTIVTSLSIIVGYYFGGG
jgi:hypothetical protein